MSWFQQMDLVVLSIIAVIQIVALALLYRYRNKRKNKHQTYIIAALCASELNGAFSIIAIRIILIKKFSVTLLTIFWFYVHLFVRLTYYSTMTLLTIDRFLVFYLNMRYLTVFTPERLKKSLICIYLISFLIYICFVCLIILKMINWLHIAHMMYMPYFIWDLIYIGQVVGTYIYIFIKYKKHRKLKKEQKVKSNNKEHFKLLVPTLIIVTYLVFFCIPDIGHFIFQFHYLDEELFYNLFRISYRIAWLADPIIYIYNCKILSKSKLKCQHINTAKNYSESRKL